MVVTREEGGLGRMKKVKGRSNTGDGRRLDLGW